MRMRDTVTVEVEITRSELCDLILACTCANRACGGSKWSVLREHLIQELHDYDALLDSLDYE